MTASLGKFIKLRSEFGFHRSESSRQTSTVTGSQKLKDILCSKLVQLVPTTPAVTSQRNCHVLVNLVDGLGYGASGPSRIKSPNALSVSSIPLPNAACIAATLVRSRSTLSTRRRGRQVHGRRRRRRITGRRWGRRRNGIGVLRDERVESAREARRRATRRWRRRQARRSTTDARGSARSAVTAVAGVSTIASLSTHGLVPGRCARGRRSTAVRVLAAGIVAIASIAAIGATVATIPIAIAAVAAVTSPGRRTTRRTVGGTALVTVVVPGTPRSRAASRATRPGPSIASTARRAVGAGSCLDARGSSASTAEFLHELL
jgi:hypothetical protein